MGFYARITDRLYGIKKAFPSGEGGLTRRSADVKTDEESEIKKQAFSPHPPQAVPLPRRGRQMWGIVLGNRGGIVRLLYYLIVGEAISLPMSLRNKTVQKDGRILSSPTGLIEFRARITEALCGYTLVLALTQDDG